MTHVAYAIPCALSRDLQSRISRICDKISVFARILISTFTVPMITKLGRMGEKLKPLYLHYHSVYSHQISQNGALL